MTSTHTPLALSFYLESWGVSGSVSLRTSTLGTVVWTEGNTKIYSIGVSNFSMDGGSLKRVCL